MKQVKLDDVRETGAVDQQVHQSGEILGVGTILSQSFATFFRNWLPFTVIALIVYLPLYAGLVAIIGVDPSNIQIDPSNTVSFVTFVLGAAGLSMLSYAVMMATISYGAIEDQADRKASLGEMLTVGIKAFFPVVVAMVLTGILYMIGLVLLVIPGIIVLLMLSVTTPVIAAEGMGPIAAMRRSRELTDGYKWTILGAFIVISIIVGIAGAVISIPLSFLMVGSSEGGTIFSVSMIVSGALEAVKYAILATCGASIYTGLRRAKEGVSSEEIAKVFA
ncbi:hypothetical protein [Kordiimonas lacus]|uniref:Membrane domain of glycerophosphoryl diester phosphodiesterase n=1 Tax=Kordiimonas lacus TaxID=637679 RepID=A0A1G6U6D0_9PROT|nr:hypothetical protein [Kordiimonas lacus]SDD36982.1 hypothetical protein SAMN04488071_0490 [Kordiimonas lacus]